MKKISIIIPAYNVEDYIKQCLNSVLKQDMIDDLEVIIINDGSTDNTYNICKSIVDKQKDWILINQKNSGVSIARNNGLKIATGEYIAFLDSDDYLVENVLGKMYENAKKNNSDILISKLNAFDSKGSYGYYSDKYINSNRSFLFKENRNIIRAVSVCGKLFINKLAKGSEFIPNTTHEDNYFSILNYTRAKIITTIDEYVYNRRIRESGNKSITQNLSLTTYKDLLLNYKKAIIDIGQNENSSFVISFCIKASLRYIINNIDKKDKKRAREKHLEFLMFLNENKVISKSKFITYNFFSFIYYVLASLAKVVRIA